MKSFPLPQQWKSSGLYTVLTLKIITLIVFPSPQILAIQLSDTMSLIEEIQQLELRKPFQNDQITSEMHCNKAKNMAASSCSWNVYILDTDFSHDRNGFWKCKLSGIPLKPRQHDGVCVGGKKRTLWGSFFVGGLGQDFQSWGLSFSVTTRQICAQALP